MASPRNNSSALNVSDPRTSAPGIQWDSARPKPYTHGFPRSRPEGRAYHQAFSRHETPTEYANWREYTFLDVFLFQLPAQVTTLELYMNFKYHGNVSKIDIRVTREGKRARTAVVRFKPPPSTPFWEQSFVDFLRDPRRKSGFNGPIKIRVRLSENQRKHFVVKSPVRPELEYDEEIVLPAESIDFGVLVSPNTMTVMETKRTGSRHPVKIVLNLQERRKEIEVYFPHLILSDNNQSGVTREYRFSVALDQSFSIIQTQVEGDQLSFVIDLESAPPFKKKLDQAHALSHKNDSTRWFEDDSWARQTDIVRHKNSFQMIDKTPVTVRKNLNCICIGRWNTFRITINQSQITACRIFREALQDYNVLLRDIEDFQLIESTDPPEPSVWSILDETSAEESPRAIGNEERLTQSFSSIYLPFSVRYQLEVCISHGWLNEYNINKEFLQALSDLDENRAKRFLVCVVSRRKRFFNPMEIFDDIEFRRPVKAPRIPEACIEIYHATVTATTILFNTPSVEMTNRIVRRYREYVDRFLRVRFLDDEYRGNSKIHAVDNWRMDFIFRRVKRTLRHGIKFGGRHYRFLAWGNSQLREHGAYFFASGPGTPTASQIRAVMGEFDHETIVAKRAARIGQCFSTTRPIQLRLPRVTQDNLIPDINRNGYTFTDGVGQISQMAATIAAHQLKIPAPVPSVFQFRLGGCKGILTVSPLLRGNDIKVRQSQFKFNSQSGELEVIRHSEFWHAYLNRQLILVLSELGVSDEVFLRKQKKEIDELEYALNDDVRAVHALRDRVDPNRMTLILADLIACGFRRFSDPFVTSLLRLWRAWCLKYLKEKAKLPVVDGAFVLGTVDETATLRGHFEHFQPLQSATVEEKLSTLPEVFLQITDPHTGNPRVIQETCIIARNPSLHPGDVRVVKAIDVPNLHHLRDVLVLPQTGDRDLPSMCSGGDLDGDDYVVIWDEELIPTTWNAPPFHYDAPEPRRAQGAITQEDFIQFFHDYMKNDSLGRIAHAHLAWGDFLNNGIRSEQCLELAQLHSIAVDYPKTGVPAQMERRLTPPSYPHFMEKNGRKHNSVKILGQLYEQVRHVNFVPAYESTFDPRILNAYVPSQSMMQSAQDLKHEYDRAMQRIMAQHCIKTEFEVWATFVMDHSKAAPDYKFHEEIGQMSTALKDQYFESIVEIVGGRDYDSLAPFAVSAYKATQAQVAAKLREFKEHDRDVNPEEMPFITFPWVLHEVMGKIAENADQVENGGVQSAVVIDGKLVAGTNTNEFDIYGNPIIEELISINVTLTLTVHQPPSIQSQRFQKQQNHLLECLKPHL